MTALNGASVRLLECDEVAREALFRGAMRRVRRAERMMLRFTLLQRAPGERFTRVRAPGLSRWKRSRRGVRRFVHRQRVRGLSAGFEYRMRVDFRWVGKDGGMVRRRRSSSRVCSSVEPLPNLRVTAIDGGAEGSGERYWVTVQNSGRAASPQSALRLTVDGKPQAPVPVPELQPGESALATAVGPRCAGRVRATVDPAGLVLESREGDNSLQRGCP
ncbi:MAG: hypothetical protein M3350_06845 [Actinomycetota bacterium]|nr:hypothetical protein [Actinomycetota bacterium]